MTDDQGFKLVLVEGEEGVAALWRTLGAHYEPPLWEAVPFFEDYIEKLARNAQTYEFYVDEALVGGASFYANDLATRIAYLSQFAIHGSCRGRGLGAVAIEEVCRLARMMGMSQIRLEVLRGNTAARSLYEKAGFEYEEDCGNVSMFMRKTLLENEEDATRA